MERTLNVDEKIRKAEEIYYKRKQKSNNRETARVNVNYEKNEFLLFKKVFLQIAICAFVYVIIYLVQTTNFVFSSNVIEKTKYILNYDIDIENIWNKSYGYISGMLNINKEGNETMQNSTVEENTENNQEEIDLNKNSIEENIGGEVIEEIEENLTQTEIDEKYILENKSLIIPLQGIITSRFGPRESDNPKVSKYHTGIDIAVNEGTAFIASMSGTVTEVSNEGAYRDSCNNCRWRY